MTHETEVRHGTIKWFDFSKKYGFVKFEDEQDDAMLHLSCLQQFDITAVPKGSAVEVVVEKTKHGLAVQRVVSLTPPESSLNGANYVPATVKWFNGVRGYGFVTRGPNTPDVFVHAVTVKASSLVELKTDQKVLVVIEEGTNGPKVVHIKAA